MQRVRIGLMGLAVVFLLVLLAAAFLGLAGRDSDVQRPGGSGELVANVAGGAPVAADPKEPLAELGVTPGGAGDDSANAPAIAAPPAPARQPVTIPPPPAPAPQR